jgi:hypothetical protein
MRWALDEVTLGRKEEPVALAQHLVGERVCEGSERGVRVGRRIAILGGTMLRVREGGEREGKEIEEPKVGEVLLVTAGKIARGVTIKTGR